MENVKERPISVSFNCHDCNKEMVIAPVFYMHHNIRYEAWAHFWFDKEATGRGLCKIIYGGHEYAPSTAIKEITGTEVDGWKFWRYESKEGILTLDELAATL